MKIYTVILLSCVTATVDLFFKIWLGRELESVISLSGKRVIFYFLKHGYTAAEWKSTQTPIMHHYILSEVFFSLYQTDQVAIFFKFRKPNGINKSLFDLGNLKSTFKALSSLPE